MNIDKIKVIQINLHHSQTASKCLLNFMIQNQYSIALVQEPWLNGKGSICGLNNKNVTLFYKDGNKNKRSYILVKNNLHLLDNYTYEDMVCLSLERKNRSSICIISAYFPYDSTPVIDVML